MQAIELVQKEAGTLRDELRELKRCQLQYFTLTVTGTGAILGIARLLTYGDLKANPISALTALAPLVIILPCWCIFFDKATSITRIVGFIRHLEEQLWRHAGEPGLYIGFERGLKEYRKSESRPITRHQFWIINWLTFASLSVLCLSMAKSGGMTRPEFVIASLAVGAAAVFTANLLARLLGGRYSFNANEEWWAKLIASWPPRPPGA